MTNHSDISHKNRALLYAIYLVSAVTLTGEEAMTMLGLHKDEALQIFTQGLKMALNKVNFLRNYDMVVLQALVLYLVRPQTPTRMHFEANYFTDRLTRPQQP
jgi:hypothetical protein